MANTALRAGAQSTTSHKESVTYRHYVKLYITQANLWSGGQKSHQAIVKDKVAKQTEVNNYSELTMVNVADIWRESDVWYPGRSRQRMKTGYEIRE